MSSIVVTKEDVLDQIVLRRQRTNTIEKLSNLKAIDKKTKLVHAKDYGFKTKLSMFVLPSLKKQEIVSKFETRLVEKNMNMYQKKKV